MAAKQAQERELQDTPEDNAKRWALELDEALEYFEETHKRGDEAVKRFRDDRGTVEKKRARWNLYTSNKQTEQALLLGKTPKSSVERAHADARDDQARVAGDLLQRLLNCDIERPTDGFTSAMQNALHDFLSPGLGVARLRYVAEFEQVAGKPAKKDETGNELAPAVDAHEAKASEDVETVYVHWKDFLVSPCKVWSEARWVAFRLQLTRKQLVDTYGEKDGRAIPIQGRKRRGEDKEKVTHPASRAEVWEIWDRDTKRVFHWVRGYDTVLVPVAAEELRHEGGGYEDPLGLEGFFPCPEPLVANLTTEAFLPTTDLHLARDLYDEIDTLASRIRMLLKAVRVVGVYDKTSSEVKRILSELADNEMIPANNWGKYSQQGGLKGSVDWFPIEQVVTAIQVLATQMVDRMMVLDQVSGKSDLQRGQAAVAGETATAAGIKAKFGSVRAQNRQDRFAKFCSDTQRIRAEIIAKHFDPKTIMDRSNAAFAFEDQGLVMKAVELIKAKFGLYRIEVKPENVSLTDFAQLKQEKTELLEALTVFFQAMAPVVQSMPAMKKHLLRLAQWTVSGLRGSSEIEGVFDQAVTEQEQLDKAAAANPQAAPPDPKVVAQQMKGQQDMQKVQADLQADIVRTQVEVQADAQREQNQMVFNVREHQQKAAIAAAYRPKEPAAPGRTRPIGGTP